MAEYLFPDNTVLCNFAAVDRLNLLRAVLDGRGRWTYAVAREVVRQARKQGITTRETIDIARLAIAAGLLTAESAFALMLQMADCDRHPRLPRRPLPLNRVNQ